MIGLTLLLSVTGMCLRPPLMIPFVLVNTRPVPGSTLDSDNPWHDKLRSIRWDASRNVWLLSSSMGFYRINDLQLPPVKLKQTPPVSPYGSKCISSPKSGRMADRIFQWPLRLESFHRHRPRLLYGTTSCSRSRTTTQAAVLVNGFTDDLVTREVIFEYDNGARNKENNLVLPAMPDLIKQQPMSLWNFCLELHVGRCYSPFLGIFSDLFVLFPDFC